MRTIYVATWRYRTPSIAEVFVEKETDKLLWVDGYEDILGHVYLGKTINKKSAKWFDDIPSALEYLVGMAERELRGLGNCIYSVGEHIDAMQEMIKNESKSV